MTLFWCHFRDLTVELNLGIQPQPLFALVIIRKHPFNALPEFRTVVVMVQMTEFMDYHVVHHPVGCDDDLPVERYLPSGATTSPSSLEGLDANG